MHTLGGEGEGIDEGFSDVVDLSIVVLSPGLCSPFWESLDFNG